MARPRKCRMVCHFPQTLVFRPEGTSGEDPPITMTVEEYETIRLIDGEGLSQEQCSEQMCIARTTVQQIYATARRKLAQMLVQSRPLEITGGDYQLCSGQNTGCSQCFRNQFKKPKGDHVMRTDLFQPCGHC